MSHSVSIVNRSHSPPITTVDVDIDTLEHDGLEPFHPDEVDVETGEPVMRGPEVLSISVLGYAGAGFRAYWDHREEAIAVRMAGRDDPIPKNREVGEVRLEVRGRASE